MDFSVKEQVASPYLASALAVDPLPNLELSGPWQVFQVKDWLICQWRSPVLEGYGQAFVAQFLEWCKLKGVTEIVLLTGLDAGYRVDADLRYPSWIWDNFW